MAQNWRKDDDYFSANSGEAFRAFTGFAICERWQKTYEKKNPLK